MKMPKRIWARYSIVLGGVWASTKPKYAETVEYIRRDSIDVDALAEKVTRAGEWIVCHGGDVQEVIAETRIILARALEADDE